MSLPRGGLPRHKPTIAQMANWDTAYGWGDHSLAGYLLNVVEDTTPQLGGNLDVNGFDITSATNGDIDIYPHGSGTLTLGGTGSGGTVLTAGIGGVSITTLSDNADITLDPHGTGDIILSANVGIKTTAPDVELHILGSGGAVAGGMDPSALGIQAVIENAGTFAQLGLSSASAYGEFVTAQDGANSPVWIGWYGSADGYKPNDCEIAANGDFWLYHNTAGDLARVDSTASLFLKEKSGGVASASVAGWGQLWIKNTTPCELWFTDDAGTSTKIA